VLSVLPLARPAVSLADGGGNDQSAGDNQYVDPLAGTQPAAKAKPRPKPRPASPTASTAPATSTSSSSATSSSSSTAAAAKATATRASRAHTLPRTGLPIALIAAVGLALLAAGLALRRVARAP
jgi:hypothetical protein